MGQGREGASVAHVEDEGAASDEGSEGQRGEELLAGLEDGLGALAAVLCLELTAEPVGARAGAALVVPAEHMEGAFWGGGAGSGRRG